jgi:DNA-directed RNA polymerase specialized sigma24 family protein
MIDRTVSHIQYLLSKYRLNHLYEVDEIYHEVILRVARVLSQGRDIENLSAYCNKIAESIIFYLVKQEIKRRAISEVLADVIEPEDSDELTEYGEALPSALNQLKLNHHSDFQLIFFYYFSDLSWREITERIYGENYTTANYATTRQQGYRARLRLRSILEEIISRNRLLE